MLAGPNGSGKTTLYETRVAPSLSVPFINADHIQKHELQDDDITAAYKAARIAAERRDECLAQGKSFATESVFSHISKVDLIKQAKALGYRIMMFHISVDDPDLSVARVSERVKDGGHAVPEKKIRQRYDRNGALIREAILLSEIGHVFDNSKLNQPPERVLSFSAGRLSFVKPVLPEWVFKIYGDDLKGG
ncbi:zeta toxin family protein [Roseibium sp.]|uniref:zeta toxin family protein n=1 Tax=Roseibium sp. TaxID=1936156 RepID=UPI003B50C86D